MMAQAEKESHEAFAKEAEEARLAEEERRLENEEKMFEERIASGEDVCVITEEGKRAKMSGEGGEMDDDECGGATTTAVELNGSVNGDANGGVNGDADGEKSKTATKEGCVECEGAATNSALLETAAKYREQCEKLERQSEEVDAEGQRLEVQMATEEEIQRTLTSKLENEKEAETKSNTSAPTAGATTSAPKEAEASTSTSLSAKNQALLEKKRRMQKMGF